MTIRKNPDYTVWLGDVWHWARQPPGIYVCIIVILAGGLWYSLSTPSPTKIVTYSAPQVARAPVIPQSQVEPPLASCLGGTVYDVLTNQCLASESGTQNNCRVDYIFIDKVNACVEVQTPRGYKVYAGNYFRLSGIPPARRVTVVQGYIWVADFPMPKQVGETFYERESTRISGVTTIYAPEGARIRLTDE